MTSQELLDSWIKVGLVEAAKKEQLAEFILSQSQDKGLNLYLWCLLGIGGVISLVCILGVLIISQLIEFDSEIKLRYWGIIIISLAIFLSKIINGENASVVYGFFIQLSLCAMAVGKILLVFGSYKFFGGNDWGITISVFLVTIATYSKSYSIWCNKELFESFI